VLSKSTTLLLTERSEYDFLQGLLGDYVLFGLRSRAPKVGTSRTVQEGDQFNVIQNLQPAALPNAPDCTTFQAEPTSNTHVKLVFRGKELKISLAYYRQVFNSSTMQHHHNTPISRALRFCTSGVAELPSNKLKIGHLFEDDTDTLYRVVNINNGAITCQDDEDSTADPVVFTDIPFVTAQINNYE
jgi:hypothetical protein